MDLTKFKFPEPNGVNMAFSTYDTIPELLNEAMERGFASHNFNNPYNRLFINLFFSGGTVKFKEGIDPEYKKRVWNYCKALMKSFAPKHEHKEAVCAMLMSEILEPERERKQENK